MGGRMNVSFRFFTVTLRALGFISKDLQRRIIDAIVLRQAVRISMVSSELEGNIDEEGMPIDYDKLISQRESLESMVSAMREVVRTSEGRRMQPPGCNLRKMAEFFFSPRTFKEILEPTLRDMFDEYCEALAAK